MMLKMQWDSVRKMKLLFSLSALESVSRGRNVLFCPLNPKLPSVLAPLETLIQDRLEFGIPSGLSLLYLSEFEIFFELRTMDVMTASVRVKDHEDRF